MSRNGIGIGSAFLTLIFVALCLAVFAMISHASAENEIAFAKAEAAFVKHYYEADALAASIVEELLSTDTIPPGMFGADIASGREECTDVLKVEFSLPISQTRELFVSMSLMEDAYDILSWRIRDANEWLPDTSMPVRRP